MLLYYLKCEQVQSETVPYAAFTRSNRLDQLSDQLSARQLDERLYGQTVDSTGWNDSWI